MIPALSWPFLKKWLLRSLFAGLGIVCILLCFVLFALGTSPGRALSVGLVNTLASSNEQTIELESLDSVLGELKLGRVRLSDQKGVWLEAQGLSARYSLADLLFLTLSADHITLDHLHVVRPPVATKPATPDPQAPLIPELPALQGSIGKISVGKISLGEAVLGKAASLSLDGQLSVIGQPLQVGGSLNIAHKDGGDGTIRAKWDFAPDNNRRLISLSVSEPRGGLLARLLKMTDLPAIAVSLKGDGPVENWQSKLSVALDDRPTLSGEVTARLAGPKRRIKANLNGQLSRFLPSQLIPLVAGDSALVLTIEETETGRFSLPVFSYTSGLARLSAEGVVDLDKEALDLATWFQLGEEKTEIILERENASPLHMGALALTGRLAGTFDKAQIDLRGSLTHAKQADLSLDQLAFAITSSAIDLLNITGSFDTKLSLAQLTTGTPAIDNSVSGPISFTSTSKIQDGVITLTQTMLNAGMVRASLGGEIGADQLDLKGEFGLGEMNKIDPSLKGAILGGYSIQGAIDNPQITLAAKGDALSIANKPLTELSLNVTADAKPTARVDLTARYGNAPIKLVTELASREDGGQDIPKISLTAPGTQVIGALALSPHGLAQGTLDARIADLAKLGPLLLQPDLKGSLNANINLSAKNGYQSINIEAKAPQLAKDGLSIGNLRLKAAIVDPSNSMTVDAGLDVANLRVGKERVQQISARMSGQNGRLPFELKARVSGEPMSASGALTQTARQTIVDLNRFSVRWQRIALGLTKAARIDLTDGVVLSKPLALSVDGGSVVISGAVKDKLDLAVAVRKLPLSIANKIAPTGEAVAGQASLDARISGSSANPSASWNATLSNLSAKSTRKAGVPVLAVASSGTLQNNRIATQNVIKGGGTKLDVGGTVALGNQTLDLSAKGTLPFSLAARALADAGLRLDGTGALSATIKGRTSAPSIVGSLSTKGARFIELSSGLTIRDLSGTLRLAGDNAQLDNIKGRLGKEGILSIDGTVGLAAAAQMPADINLSVRNGDFKHEDILTSLFDADLALKGKLAARSVLSGAINLKTTEISIPESLPDSISAVSVQHKNATGKLANQVDKLQPATKTSSGQGPAIALNLNINSPRRIYVRGRGMDAELGGSIRVAGSTASPNPIGSVSLLRGRMDLLTKRLDFDRGSVGFAGTLDPSLDFSASTTSGGATYTLGVGGYASAPEILLSSSPQAPEDEILSRLFFDRDLADLSPLQLAQLANAVATISGVNSGPGVLDRLRNLAGIDNVDIKSDEKTGETTVGVGRYLNDKTYVNVEKGTSSNSGKVTIDLEISSTLKARGEADTSGNSKAGIFFEQDY